MVGNEVPVGNVEHCREKPAGEVVTLGNIADKGGDDQDDGKKSGKRRQKTAAAAIPKRAQRHSSRTTVLVEKEAGNQKS
ncbi:unannotated protein [freshwater metagenome]|uniref:Unannotated protein n=1 Tax=freshwater metagenome TaxID=449393 RepID=A0A6J6IB19_9ZZZZ